MDQGRNKKQEFKKFESNEDEYITYQNSWGMLKAVLRGKFVVLNAYINKMERSQINDLVLYLKALGKLRASQS